MKNKRNIAIIGYSLAAVAFLYVIEQIVMPGYAVKSAMKIAVFFVVPSLLRKRLGSRKSGENRSVMDSSHWWGLFLLGGGAFISILGIYILLRTKIDLTAIMGELEGTLKIQAGNFLLVGFYITFVNSALEEYFFRRVIFLDFNKSTFGERMFSYAYSALLFSAYHLSIFKTWFDLKILLLSLAGLITVGIIFNYLDERKDTIIYSYAVHACGDAAIISIGLKMFGLI